MSLADRRREALDRLASRRPWRIPEPRPSGDVTADLDAAEEYLVRREALFLEPAADDDGGDL